MPKENNWDPRLIRKREEALVQRYRDALLRRAKRLCRWSDIDPEDLVQETLERALKHFDFTVDFLEDGREGQRIGWLAITLTNLFRDRIRRRQVENRIPVPVDLEEPPGDGESAWSRVSDAQLRHAIDQLSPRQHQVLTLRLEGWSLKEIATELGVTVNTVGVVAHQARARLRELLVPFMDVEP